jgi:hypothetical protein
MSISDQYTDFLFNYLTVDGKCAHHIDRPKSISINQNTFLKISNVYFSDQIEFKINKNKLLEITQRFFNTNQKIQCFIFEKVGVDSDKTNITVNIPKNIISRFIVSNVISDEDNSISSNISIESLSSNDEEEINDFIQIEKKNIDKDKYFL